MSLKEIHIIGLAGSPRERSNSTSLLSSLLSGASQAGARCELIRVSELDIKPCTHCDHCRSAGECIFSDDMLKIYQHMKEADAIVFASPIYFMGLSSQLKVLVDRCQMFWGFRDNNKKSLIELASGNRKGIFIATGARNGKKVFAGVKETMRWVFDTLECEFWDSILVGNCESAGDIFNQVEILEEAYDMGKKLAESYK